jgi:hypothetical protein
MNVEDAIGKGVEQRAPDEPHETGQAHQVHLPLLERRGERPVVGLAPGEAARKQAGCLEAGLVRPGQAGRRGPVGDDQRDRGIETPGRDGVDDRLQVRSTSRNEHTEAALHDVW